MDISGTKHTFIIQLTAGPALWWGSQASHSDALIVLINIFDSDSRSRVDGSNRGAIAARVASVRRADRQGNMDSEIQRSVAARHGTVALASFEAGLNSRPFEETAFTT